MTKLIKICLVEDDPDIRELTKSVLELNEDIRCVSAYASGEEFIQNLDNLDVDLVLMDIGLPGMTGTECVRYCNLKNLTIDFIMYTTHFVAEEVFEALKAGAKGYILKGGSPTRLVDDIYEQAEGGSPMSPQISRLVTNSFNHYQSNNSDFEKLTQQEKEILIDLNKGLNYKEIATQRFISPHTVRAHLRSIYEKLHVHTKLEAIRVFQKHHP